MLALCRAGRQSEALAAAAKLRRILADELGLDPSPQVVEIEQRVLLQDPSLLIAKAPAAWSTAGEATKAHGTGSQSAELATHHLVGREAAVRVVEAAVADAADGRGCVLVFQAPAGFGKSTMMQVL